MKKSHFYIPGVLILVFLGCFLLLVYKFRLIPTGVSAQVLALYKRCSISKSSDTRTDCMFNGYKKLVTKDNFEEVVTATHDAYAPNDCHAPAHLVAKIAFEKGAAFSDILNKCTDKCGYGCLHGAFQSRFESDLVGFIGNIDNFCSDIDQKNTNNLIACWHIVGHGVAEYYGTDIVRAIAGCSNLPKGLPAWHCLNGLVMEYTEPFPWTSYGFKFSPEFYLDLCSKMPGFYQRDCYGSSGYVVLKVLEDKTKAVAICDQVPNDLVVHKKCAAEDGGILALQHYKVNDIFSFCNEFKNKTLMGECIISAGNSLVTGGFEDPAKELCSLVGGDLRRECFSSIGVALEKFSDPTSRSKLCSGLSKTDSKSCLSAPLDSRQYLSPSYQKGI